MGRCVEKLYGHNGTYWFGCVRPAGHAGSCNRAFISPEDVTPRHDCGYRYEDKITLPVCQHGFLFDKQPEPEKPLRERAVEASLPVTHKRYPGVQYDDFEKSRFYAAVDYAIAELCGPLAPLTDDEQEKCDSLFAHRFIADKPRRDVFQGVANYLERIRPARLARARNEAK